MHKLKEIVLNKIKNAKYLALIGLINWFFIKKYLNKYFCISGP